MQTEFGVCYYPEHWPEAMWRGDAAEMVEIGLSWVRIGEFAWSRLEPREGDFRWEWLDRAVDVLGGAGLKIVLGTPSATPPRWMLSKFPGMLSVDKQGNPRGFGSRRHYCFSHAGYRDFAAQMAERMAERYGRHEAVHVWQTDNEYGCHETVVSYSRSARDAFRAWLTKKYKTVDALNAAWGNVFWSMEYGSFDEVELPNLTVTEPNPAHVMDFRRFSSDQVISFNRAQCEAIRRHSDRDILHNYMGRILDFDHFELGEDLEIASWDTYPLGFLEDRINASPQYKLEYLRTGDPDFQAMHHDLYRAVGRGRWWVLEQQPGPVNWAGYNPAPAPGAVRMWMAEAAAHGAELVSFFRWRQAPFAQEQMHAGLKTPDNKPGTTYAEIQSAIADIKSAQRTNKIEDAPVGIVFDYASAWAWDIQPQGRGFTYFDLVFDIYRALRRQGVSVDFIPPKTASLGGRKLVFIPGLFTWNEALSKAAAGFEVQIVLGPRTASKTNDFSVVNDLPEEMGIDVRVNAVDTFPVESPIALQQGGNVKIWREFVSTTDIIVETYEDDSPFHIQNKNRNYIAGWPDDAAMDRLMSGFLRSAQIDALLVQGGLRVREIGGLKIYTNYGPEEAKVEGRSLGLADILIMDASKNKVLLSP